MDDINWTYAAVGFAATVTPGVVVYLAGVKQWGWGWFWRSLRGKW